MLRFFHLNADSPFSAYESQYSYTLTFYVPKLSVKNSIEIWVINNFS